MVRVSSVHHLTPTIVSSRKECQTISRLYILTSVHPSKFLGLLRLPPSCCLLCEKQLQLDAVHLCNIAVTIKAAIYLNLQSRSGILLLRLLIACSFFASFDQLSQGRLQGLADATCMTQHAVF